MEWWKIVLVVVGALFFAFLIYVRLLDTGFRPRHILCGLGFHNWKLEAHGHGTVAEGFNYVDQCNYCYKERLGAYRFPNGGEKVSVRTKKEYRAAKLKQTGENHGRREPTAA